jgi:hypothetical protein
MSGHRGKADLDGGRVKDLLTDAVEKVFFWLTNKIFRVPCWAT